MHVPHTHQESINVVSTVPLKLWLGTQDWSVIIVGECSHDKSASRVFYFSSSFQGDKEIHFLFPATPSLLTTPSTSPVRATLSWVKESRQAYIINQTAGLIFDLLQCSITWGEPCRHGKTVWYSLKSPLWCTQSTHRLRFLMISSFKYMLTASFCLTVRKR